MYTEERPQRGGLLKEFILKLILIIIFVLLLIWLVPWPNMNALNPLKDQIFNANIQTMKEAGISYFTTERLPEKVGDKTTLTLQKMLDLKLVVPFTDRNGNSCDVKKSYVSLEKQETEYLMKVNLKCGEEEDYILVHLGCYSYCTSTLCEARPESTEKPKTTPEPKTYQCQIVDGKYWGKNKTIVSKETYEKECKKAPETYQCKYVNGQYWGKNKTVVSKATYEKECLDQPTSTPTPVTITYTCKIVDGKYWGSEAKIVDQATYEDQCLPKYTCQIVGNQYWGKNATVVSQQQYEDECLPKYTCQIINGQYWGKNATVVSQQQYEDECVQKELEYQYIKTETTTTAIAASYSAWSDWTVYTLKKGESIPASTALYEVEDLGLKRVQIGKITAVYETIYEEHNEMMKVNTANYKLCEEYSYVADVTTTYQVLSDWSYTGKTVEGFRENIPYDTLDTRYVLDSVLYNLCEPNCVSHPYARYKEMKRQVKVITNVGDVTATCTKVVDKPVDIYVSVPVGRYYTVLKTPEQILYGNIHQYRTRSRTLLAAASTSVSTKTLEEWSYANNQTLINAGYTMTGQTRVKAK